MADLFDYLYWRGDLTFECCPINEVDGMILARLSYIPFELALDSLPEGERTVSRAAEALLALPDIGSSLIMAQDETLLKVLGSSERFGGVTLYRYENLRDEESETQFSAVTFGLTDSLRYVAYRGTDNTILGWKEDFNMGFIFPIPAQSLAVEYMEAAAGEWDGEFIVGGHSKGGNLAVYASAFCRHLTQLRIKEVYNFDGPGFDENVLGKPGYQRICTRVRTFVPQSSIVGMLLGHKEQYTVVHSSQTGPMQHDVYSWDVDRDKFVYLETVTGGSRFIDSTLREWIAGMDIKQRETAADALYRVLAETNFTTLRAMGENWFTSAKSILQSIKSMDPETRGVVTETLKALMKSATNEFAQSMQKQLEKNKTKQ